MKKQTIISMISAVAFIIAALSFNSCTKQENAGQPIVQQTQQLVMTPEDIATFNKIMDFKKKVDYIKEKPLYKSGEEMSVDSAVWYLDAAVNLTYTFSFEVFDEFYTDSVFIEIPVNDGEINLDNLSNGYFELVDKIRDDIYADVQSENKKLFISTSEIKGQTNNTLTIKTVSTIGSKSGSFQAPSIEEPFEEGDDFKYGDMLGYCNGDSITDLDAAQKLAYFTMFNRSLYIQDIGENWYAYYTPGVTIELEKANTYGLLFKNGINNFGEYMYLYENAPTDLCLYHDYMNFYYEKLHDVVYDIVPNNWSETNGLTFRSISNQGTHSGNPGNPTKIYHLPKITYKQRWIIADGSAFPNEL